MSVAMTSPERRKAPRVQVESIVLIDIGEDNAGTISDISEGGFCFQAVSPIDAGETVYFRLRPDDRSQGRGRVAWTDETQKRGGLSFSELSAHMRQQICALAKPALPALAAVDSEELNQGEEITNESLQRSFVSAQAEQEGLFGGFAGGLVTGILVSLLVISTALMFRRQIGESLIVLGEHLASKSPSLTNSTHKVGEKASALNSSEVKYPPTSAVSKPESQVKINERDSTYISRLRQSHGKEESPATAQTSQTKLFGEQAHSKPKAPDEAQPGTSGSAATFLVRPSIGLPAVSVPLPSSLATLRLAKPSQLQQSTRASMRVDTLPYESEVRSGSSSQMYFEVGKFKEASRAKKERDKLSQLGYPATLQQKRRLWRNFYDVLVGPYQDSDKAEAAHKSLVVRGFEARPLERGYRRFVLPPGLVLNGVRIPAGDCLIRWESYIAEVKVKFEQDDHVVSTALGVWVKRDPKYENSAIVYTPNRNGWRSLNELRFAGWSRALVFSN